MNECEFSVIKYVLDPVKFEPINIGIALLDKQNKKMHTKYITNFNIFFKRLGVNNIHGFEASFMKHKPIIDVKDEKHLWSLHDSFHGSVFYSEPIKIHSEIINDSVQKLYAKMISIPNKQTKQKNNFQQVHKKITSYIMESRFPSNTFKKEHHIATEIPQIRDYAFLREDKIVITVDVLNFKSNSILDDVKLFLHEIKSMYSSRFKPKNRPTIFSFEQLDERKSSITEPIEQLEKNEIQIIEPVNQQKKINEIREMI